MWDLPGSGLKPMSPALAGRFLTTAPPGKPPNILYRLLSAPFACLLRTRPLGPELTGEVSCHWLLFPQSLPLHPQSPFPGPSHMWGWVPFHPPPSFLALQSAWIREGLWWALLCSSPGARVRWPLVQRKSPLPTHPHSSGPHIEELALLLLFLISSSLNGCHLLGIWWWVYLIHLEQGWGEWPISANHPPWLHPHPHSFLPTVSHQLLIPTDFTSWHISYLCSPSLLSPP